MVRQYKIHTNLDGTDDKVWDVTNGNLRFYQPSNLGLDIVNNISVTDGIGVVGSRNLTHPDIEFKLETFCDTLQENYEIFRSFINDILSVRFVTLEYSTEWFQVYADLAFKGVTKTEGYGRNGQFSETISFQVVTKWYTYENLTFNMIENGQVISGKSKIYGGYRGSETALQNYNRLKSNPSLNLPNLNLLDGTRYFSGDWINGESWQNDGTYKGLTVKSYQGQWGGMFKKYIIPEDGLYTWSSFVKSESDTSNIFRVFFLNNSQIPIVGLGGKFDWLRDSVTVSLKKGDEVIFNYGNSENNGGKLSVAGYKLEHGSAATPHMPSSSEVTTNDISEYFGYNYIQNQAYTYYGEEDISRLSRWDITDKIFSVVARLDPANSGQSGVKFLDAIGNEYTAMLFTPETKQDYILINTDVNDEFYQGWTGTTMLNLFPVLDFERYRTRVIDKGQMLLVNLKSAEFKIKRKADFV